MWMAGECGLKRASIANGRLYCPIHNVKQRPTSRHHRKPGDDDAKLQSRDAIRIRGFFTRFKKACLERTGGDVFAPQRGRRSAERRTNGCRASMREAQPRPDKRDRSPFGAPPRSCAGTRLGLGRASWNHRMQTGGPSPAPVQRAPRSPARAGRADTQTACRLRATNSARRNRTRSVSRRHRLTSLTMNGMDAVIQIRARAVKGFSVYADKTRSCAARLPPCASTDAFHSIPKIRKREVVPVNQGLLRCTNLFGLHGGVRIAQRVGWVEPTGPARSGRPDDRLRDTLQVPPRQDDGFRKNSTHPTGLVLLAAHRSHTKYKRPRPAEAGRGQPRGKYDLVYSRSCDSLPDVLDVF